MGHTYVEEKSLKTLEDLAVSLTVGILSLITLQNMQVRAIKIGIMPEDMAERANTIVWDIRRLISHYQGQLEATLELLPPEFDAVSTIEKLKKAELTKARSLIRKSKKNEKINT